MKTVSTRKARAALSDLLTQAECGETICITRRGQVVAQLVPPPPETPKPFPDLKEFRDSIKVKPGSPTSVELIRQMRDEERS